MKIIAVSFDTEYRDNYSQRISQVTNIYMPKHFPSVERRGRTASPRVPAPPHRWLLSDIAAGSQAPERHSTIGNNKALHALKIPDAERAAEVSRKFFYEDGGMIFVGGGNKTQRT